MRILANDGITPVGRETLERAGYTVCTEHYEQEELATRINEDGYEILLVRSATRVDEELIDACPGLKMIGRGGVGMDNIDVYYAQAAGITVFNTPNSSSDSVAELVIGQMFAISRSLHELNQRMPNDDFKVLKKGYSHGQELRGKTLGIIGFGRIGRSLAGYALGIGMDVMAVDLEQGPAQVDVRVGKRTVSFDVNVESDIERVLPHCDFVSVHMPPLENGDAIITIDEMSMMKGGSILINAARGGVVNEEDLILALKRGNILAAALDVFEDEPSPNRQLIEHPMIFCTPHIGAGTEEAQEKIGLEMAETIIATFGTVQ